MSIAVVVPCYKVKNEILFVLKSIPSIVDKIYIVDDCCPEGSGRYAASVVLDSRIKLLINKHNLGVGGAVINGYKSATEDGYDIIVKIDGDGQMDPSLILDFIEPIVGGIADYTKGNRFYDLNVINIMPKLRLFGNASLSFISKLSTGYWHILDPNNGYTAIHSIVLKNLPLKKISKRYFFETDMLFRLNLMRAVVMDIPMDAKYSSEVSSLKIRKVFLEFLIKHIIIAIKRIFYNYYLRDISLASFELPIGLLLFIFGVTYGLKSWILSSLTGIPTLAGTVILSAMTCILGIQFVLAFLNYDINNKPRHAIHRYKTLKKTITQNLGEKN